MGRFRETEQDSDVGIDMSPLIDCVFILLIFFIVTTTFVEEVGVKVEGSQAANAPSMEENTTLVLELTAKGDVLHEGKPIGMSGVRPLVQQTLRQEEVPVIIQAAEDAQTGILMRLVDESQLAGAIDISLATK